MRCSQQLVLILILIVPIDSYAYVDPGIVGALWQGFYVLIFGIISAWVIRPWMFIKSLFHKQEKSSFSENNDNTPTSSDHGSDKKNNDIDS